MNSGVEYIDSFSQLSPAKSMQSLTPQNGTKKAHATIILDNQRFSTQRPFVLYIDCGDSQTHRWDN